MKPAQTLFVLGYLVFLAAWTVATFLVNMEIDGDPTRRGLLHRGAVLLSRYWRPTQKQATLMVEMMFFLGIGSLLVGMLVWRLKAFSWQAGAMIVTGLGMIAAVVWAIAHAEVEDERK